ncbi:MAG: site-specific integrase [Acholeplasmataceae bacterium]|nr:site-specific integrase [Acholeplasmataceae bacterium]
MKISKQVLDYYYLTESSFKRSTNEEHIRVARHIINGLEFLKIKKMKSIDATEGYKLINYFKSQTKRNNNSINKMTNYLKRVMIHYGIVTSFHQMKKLPSDTKPFKRLYHDELQTIIEYVRDLNYSTNSTVYRTYVFLALDSGMRKSELLNIQIENIDFHNNLIYLEETKTGKPRYVPFSDFSSQQVKELVSLNPKRQKLMYNFLKDRDLSSSDIKLFYKRTKTKLGIDRLYTHRFRKTFASLLADNGMPPQYVQKLLDHEKISTTMKYIQFDKIKPLEKYNQYNDWKIKSR